MRVLLTCPSLTDHGGVAGYYASVLPFLNIGAPDVSILEVGSTAAHGGVLHPLLDPLRVFITLCIRRYDLVHINPSFNLKSFLRGGIFILAATLRGKPVLVFFRGWRKDLERIVERRLRAFFRLTYKKAAAFIVLGGTFAARLREWGISCPIHLETTAVDDRLLEGFSIEKKEASFPNRGVKLLFLSSLLEKKGVFELLEAVSCLRTGGVDLTLTVAGDGPALRRIHKAVEELQLGEAVSLPGYVSGAQKVEVLVSHHIFCFPSWDEGMPNSVLEAMALGLPVVATPVGGLPDFFEDGRMGRLVPVRDPVRLAQAIRELAADPAVLRRMARYNHEYAYERFRASRVTGRLRAIYNQTLAGCRTCGKRP